MKKTIILHSVISIAFLFALFSASSCSKTNEEAEKQIEQQEAFNELLGNLDSLNSDFGITTTKFGGKDVIKSVAEIAGYMVGTTYGGSVGVWAGSAAGPAGAVVGYLFGKRYGGVIASQIFSLVAGLGCDLFSGCVICVPPSGYMKNGTFYELEKDATVGEIHNFLLSISEGQYGDYVSDNGQLK